MAKRSNKKKGNTKSNKVAQSSKKKWAEKGPLFTRFFTLENSLPIVIIMALAIGLYISSYSYGYILDDKIVITENNFTKKGISGIADIFRTESFTGYFGEQRNLVAGARYRPLSIATFALEFEVFGLNPKMSHLINALLYGLCALVLFRLLLVLFPIENRKWYWNIPFITSLIFVAHPIHTEVVANIKGRDEILCLILSLLSLLYALKYLGTKHWAWLIGMGMVFFLGLLAKENAITFLAIIPLSIFTFFRIRKKRYLPILFSLVAVIAMYLLIRFQVIGYLLGDGTPISDLMNNPFVEMDAGQKYATIMYTLGKYIWLLFFPIQLSHDYYPYAIPIGEWFHWQVLVSFFMYICLGIYAMVGFWKKNVAAYCILFFLTTISIVSNIVFPVGTFMNERFLFMPSVAFCLLLAYLFVEKIPDKISFIKPVYLQSLMLVITVLFSLKTVLRIPDWKDIKSLNKSAVKVSENSARANLFYSVALYNEYQAERDPTQKAELLTEMEAYADKALQIYPNYAYGWQMKTGYAAEHYRKDRDLNKLLKVFGNALKANPSIEFVGTYMEYLNGQQIITSQLLDFYYNIGYQDIGLRQRNYGYAIKYLNYGYQLAPQDTRIQQAISHIRQLSGR